jgi:hypothetical protein
MKKLLFSAFILCLFLPAWSQVKLHRSYLFNRGNVTKLAQQINGNATSDSQRVDNIHFWITHHIKYDAKRFVKWQTANQETNNVLRRRKTLCSGYANLFQDLCLQSGVNAIVINGYTKNDFVDICDTAYLPDHAWNKVEIDGKWKNVDDTWDAGYVEYYKTSFIRRVASRLTNDLIKKVVFKPHFIKNPSYQRFLAPENEFAVEHYPENGRLNGLQADFTSRAYDKDSAFFYLQPALMSPRLTINNTFYQLYSSLDEQEQDKNDGENALEVNPKNYFGNARYHFYNLAENWAQYQDDPKKMKKDSNYLKSMIVLSDSVLKYTKLNDSLIWEEYRDLSHKYRAKRKIQKSYNAEYVRYLKRKARHKQRHLRKIKNKKRRSKMRTLATKNRYNRLYWRHFFKPGKWPRNPNQRRADSLAGVYTLYENDIKQNAVLLRSLSERLTIELDQTIKAICKQDAYITDVTGHFHSLALSRMMALDDYDMLMIDQKKEMVHYTISDSMIQLELHYQKVYELVDSLYRIGKQNYKFTSRQKTILRRVKRSTGWKALYYSLNDDFRKSLNQCKKKEAKVQKETRRRLKVLRKVTRKRNSVGLSLYYCQAEKSITMPLEILQNKRRKHQIDNKKLKRFAKRVKVKSEGRVLSLRYKETITN